jgi:hypothetical protein
MRRVSAMGAYHGWAIGTSARPSSREKRATGAASRRTLVLVHDARRDVGKPGAWQRSTGSRRAALASAPDGVPYTASRFSR